MDYAPLVRIALRYLVGGLFFGSVEIGDRLAADPDLVAFGALALVPVIEGIYVLAKRKGWKT